MADDEIARDDSFRFKHHAPQTPEPKKGKWDTVTNSMEWISKYYEPMMGLCKKLRRDERGAKKGWIKVGCQRSMAKQIYKWMDDGEMRLEVRWLKEFSGIISSRTQ